VRALSIIPIWYALASDLRATAFGLFVLAALTDAVDGRLARRRGSPTRHGALVDPLADKVLVVGTAAALVFAGLEGGVIVPPGLFALLAVREVTAAVIRVDEHRRGVSRPADASGKAKTAAEMVALALLILARPPEPLALVGVVLLGAAVLVGFVSLAQQWPHRRRPAL
jgi:CDP-diacylglycerol--glycerol-3-phosphate 3-phosphatidyltransferase